MTARWLLPVLAALLTSCGSAEDGQGADPSGSASPATELPASFRNSDLVATANHVVNLGPVNGGLAPTEAAAVDLRTGATRVLDRPAPVPGRTYHMLETVGLADEVLVVGLDCREPFDEEEPCDADEYRVDLLDPATGTWRQTDPLPSVGSPHSVAALQALPGGGAVAELWVDGNHRSVIVVLEGERWRQVGEGRDNSYGRRCATSTEYFDLREVPVAPTPEDTEAGGSRVGFTATATSLETGEVRELAPPAVDGSFGGVGVEVACGDDQVVVATKGPGLFGPGAMMLLDGDGWSEEPGVFDSAGPVVPTESWSGGPVPVLGVTLTPQPPPPGAGDSTIEPSPFLLASIDAGDRPALITDADQLKDRSVIQLGPTGRFLILGPSTPPVEGNETPEADKPIPITTLATT